MEDSSWFDRITNHESGREKHSQRIDGLEPDTRYILRVKVMYPGRKISEPSPSVEGRTDCKGINF